MFFGCTLYISDLIFFKWDQTIATTKHETMDVNIHVVFFYIVVYNLVVFSVWHETIAITNYEYISVFSVLPFIYLSWSFLRKTIAITKHEAMYDIYI